MPPPAPVVAVPRMARATSRDALSSGGTALPPNPNPLPGLPQRIFPGQLHPCNRGMGCAIDWSVHGLIAYACHDLVVVVHPETLQVVQTFHGHTASVVQVRWSRGDDRCSYNRVRQLRLASGDVAGRVMLWSVQRSRPTTLTLATPQRGVIALEFQPENEDMLAAVYAPGLLALWNLRSSQKGDLLHLAFDPFEPTSACLVTANAYLYVLNGLPSDRNKEPNVRKFHLGDSQATSSAARKTSKPFDRFRASIKERSLMYTSPGDLLNTADIVDVVFSLTEPGLVCFVTRTEILMMDINIMQIMAVVPNEPRAPGFVQVLLARSCPEIIFCLHDNGSIAVRARKRTESGSLADARVPWSYAIVAHTDVLKPNRPDKFFSIASFPTRDTMIAGLASDGQLLIFTFEAQPQHAPRLAIVGCLDGVTSSPVAIEVVPAREVSINRIFCTAIGSRTGHLQLLDLQTGALLRDMAVMDVPLRIVKWIDSGRIVVAGWDVPPSGPVKTIIRIVNLSTGRLDDLKPDRPRDNNTILSIHISPRHQYMIVLWKDSPLDLWDLNTQSLSRSTLSTYTTICAMEWSPVQTGSNRKSSGTKDSRERDPKDKENGVERLILALVEGVMVHCSVAGGIISEENKFQHRSGTHVVTALAWEKKENQLIAGDSNGSLHFYLFKAQRTKTVSTTYGEVRRLRQCPLRSGRRLLILFAEGLAIWDLDSHECASSWQFPPEPKYGADGDLSKGADMDPKRLDNLGSPLSSSSTTSTASGGNRTGFVESVDRVVDIDWASPENPVCILSDGSIRVLDLGLRRCVSPLASYYRLPPIVSPPLLPAKEQTLLRTALELRPEWSTVMPSVAGEDDEATRNTLSARMSNMDPRTLEYLTNPKESFVVRLGRIAQFFGDTNELELWRLISLYGPVAKEIVQIAPNSIDKPPTPQPPPAEATSTAVAGGSTEAISEDDAIERIDIRDPDEALQEVWDHFGEKPMAEPAFAATPSVIAIPEVSLDQWPQSGVCTDVPAHLNTLAPANDVHKRELIRTVQLERVASTDELLYQTVHKNVVLDQHDKAIHLLLETPSNTTNFRSDALKACLIAAIKSPHSLEQTMQLVATNLIANNELMEGVQLLCLLGRGLEACTCLQNNGLWKDAATMAKTSLSQQDANVVLVRWAHHLRHTGEYEKALRLHLSMGAFGVARQLLIDQKHYERAVLLTVASESLGVVLDDLTNDQGRALAASMYVGYASYLYDMGLWTGAKFYREKAHTI